MPDEERQIRVFIASPGDLAPERRAFKETLDALNAGFGRGAKVRFIALGWEDALSTVGRRPQSTINADIDICDVFILVMWRRWGQEAPDAVPFSSYTEEEFYRALGRYEQTGNPTLFVFFKHIEAGQMADPGEQLQKVLAFRKELEQTRRVMYRNFSDELTFSDEIDRHLVAFAQGDVEVIDESRVVPLLPESVRAQLDEMRQELEEARRALEELKQQTLAGATQEAIAEQEASFAVAQDAVELAEKASAAALAGSIEEARQGFARALAGTTNLKILFLAYAFFRRIGEYQEAERLAREMLAIVGPDSKTVQAANVYGNLGTLFMAQSDEEQGEIYTRKALDLHRELGNTRGISTELGNLAQFQYHHGHLGEAESSINEALALDLKLGRKEVVARHYDTLGRIEMARGNYDDAERHLLHALETHSGSSNADEGVCIVKGNLGVLYAKTDQLDKARSAFNDCLEIAERLKRARSLAINFCNLGQVQIQQGDYPAAMASLRRSLETSKECGLHEYEALAERLIDKFMPLAEREGSNT